MTSRQPIYDKDNPESIRLLFDDIAKRYDLGNRLMSMNLHTLWNEKLIKTLLHDRTPINYLDICSGTGDIAFRMIQALEKKNSYPQTYLIDFSSQMLNVAKKNSLRFRPFVQKRIHFDQGRAEKLPYNDRQFDTISIAYGIRNIKELDRCFKETYRVLDEGGKIAILELTRPKNGALRLFHRLYLKTLLPVIGKVCISNKEAYQYLQASIENFICPQTIVHMLEIAGFVTIEANPIFGGIATLFSAKKPG
jgi:demethylmenaquinone methyltransferase / 2-methoxy-6-polyprenyl-1,4-benzoquinol methylase